MPPKIIDHTVLFRPAIGPRLRKLLFVVIGLVALLGVNSLYLAGITLFEWLTGKTYQDLFYQYMFLLHLGAGLLLLLPVITFGLAHMRNTWGRPNRNAVRAGLALFLGSLVLLISGILLTRFDFFTLPDPTQRQILYWLHTLSPLILIWFFLLHRLAGRAIRWRVGLGWFAIASSLVIVLLVLQTQDPRQWNVEGPISGEQYFFPSLARTASGNFIPAKILTMDSYCQQCHADSHQRWRHSMHRFSSFNNPAYLFSVREVRKVTLERDGNVQATRFCAGCHDPAPFFSGAFDDPNFDDVQHPTAQAGITCTTCHAITHINSPRGNADFTIEEPLHYPFTFSEQPFLRWLNRQLVKAKPAFHKKTFLKPLHRSPEFCGTCHKVHLPKALNHYKWLRGQNHFDSYQLSGVSGHGATSFYYPPKALHRCQQCHMKLLEAHNDFGGRPLDNSGQLKIHDHLFPAANTAIPHLLGLPDWVNQEQQTFLKNALRLDIFGLKQGATLTSPLVAPLRPTLPQLQPGQRYLLEAVVRTIGMGHLFTQGTADSNQVWLEVTLEQDGRVIGQSGQRNKIGQVDPWAHFINAYVLDRHGQRIDRRNVQDIYTTLYNHQIPPGAADVIHYAFTVPADARGALHIQIKVHYRKFDTRYMQYFQGDDFLHNDLPIITLAQDQITLPLGTGPIDPPAASPIPTWERWNDYGIALLRKGKKGELRQAEQAFLEVEKLARADGPLNLARVYCKEGRLDDAAQALQRTAWYTPPAPPWVVAWFTGVVNQQNGHLDEAIANFRTILETRFADARQREFDFSEDYRVINELGQTLLERAKRERSAERKPQRKKWLEQAREQFQRTLRKDPENQRAHFNLALIFQQLGNAEQAQYHRNLHARYQPDDNARDRTVAHHRRANPAADHAAEDIVIYDLQRTLPTPLGPS